MQAIFLDSVEPRLGKGKAFQNFKIKKPEGDIAKILKNISEEFDSIDIGSYPFYKPPEIGTNIVFRGKELKLIESYQKN